jgi:hypothetical protein
MGERGVHFYDDESCNFLSWKEVLEFTKNLPNEGNTDPFADRLVESLANYKPEAEFLAVRQNGDTISVELYFHSETDHVGT